MNRIRTLDLYVYLPGYASIDYGLIHHRRNLPHYFKEFGKIMGHLARRFIPWDAPECLEEIRVRIEISDLILCGYAENSAGSNLRDLMRSLKRIVRPLRWAFDGGLSWELSCSKP
jgi:hypothetical protein